MSPKSDALQPLLNQGIKYLQQGKSTEARWYFEQVLQINPSIPIALTNLGIIEAQTGHPHKALELLEKSIQLNPKELATWQALGLLHSQQENYGEAEMCFQNAIKLDKTAYIVWDALGLVYFNQQNYMQAKEHFQKAISLKENFLNAWNNLIAVYIKEANLKEGLTVTYDGLKIFPENNYLLDKLGEIYRIQNQTQKAQEIFENILEKNPNFLPAWYHLKQIYVEQKKVEKINECNANIKKLQAST